MEANMNGMNDLKPIFDNLGNLVASVSAALAAVTYLIGKGCEILAWLGSRRKAKEERAIEDGINTTYVEDVQAIKKEAGDLSQEQARAAQKRALAEAVTNAAKVGIDLVKASGGLERLKGRIQGVFNRVKGKLTGTANASLE
jgi:hypothetical protein